MGELARCFVCLMSIRPGLEVAVLVRTAVPKWERRVVCTPCGYKIKEWGEMKVYSQDEWWTIRAWDGMDDVVETLSEGFE